MQLFPDPEEWRISRGWFILEAVARLRTGVAAGAAEAEATTVHRAARAEQIEAGDYDANAEIVLEPLILARGVGAAAESRVALWLAGVSLLLLVIVCANVANLLLARAVRARRESAVRLALGIGRARLLRQVVLESLALAALGAGAALAVTIWG
ncbi:MAG: FtsX-like permease family protein, partial [Longimicrobiales bacterium]